MMQSIWPKKAGEDTVALEDVLPPLVHELWVCPQCGGRLEGESRYPSRQEWCPEDGTELVLQNDGEPS